MAYYIYEDIEIKEYILCVTNGDICRPRDWEINRVEKLMNQLQNHLDNPNPKFKEFFQIESLEYSMDSLIEFQKKLHKKLYRNEEFFQFVEPKSGFQRFSEYSARLTPQGWALYIDFCSIIFKCLETSGKLIRVNNKVHINYNEIQLPMEKTALTYVMLYSDIMALAERKNLIDRFLEVGIALYCNYGELWELFKNNKDGFGHFLRTGIIE